MLKFERLEGHNILPALDAVAKLRIEVFRDFPYLYDGTLAYEKDYLATFAKAKHAMVVVARDGETIVGASTGCALVSEHASLVDPFRAHGLNVDSIFYCAESVLLQSHRGQGAGKRFFAFREAYAKDLGFSTSAFCAVIRPDDHEEKPDDYIPHDGFWRGLGYASVPNLRTTFSWTDLGQNHETSKQLQVWMKAL